MAPKTVSLHEKVFLDTRVFNAYLSNVIFRLHEFSVLARQTGLTTFRGLWPSPARWLPLSCQSLVSVITDYSHPHRSESPCMGISDEIDDATVAIDETTALGIKATIWPGRFFTNHFNIKICSVSHLVIIECLFSLRMSLASLYTSIYWSLVSLLKWKCQWRCEAKQLLT